MCGPLGPWGGAIGAFTHGCEGRNCGRLDAVAFMKNGLMKAVNGPLGVVKDGICGLSF